MKALIIAAGKGSRLSSLGDCKPLIELEGIPLIERVMLSCMQAGIREFRVVTGFNGHKIRQRLAGFSKNRALSLAFIENPHWERPNGLSVLAAEEDLKAPFFLLMSDHLFDPAIIRELRHSGIHDGQVKLSVDKRIHNHPLVDMDDVTRVKVEKGYILDIGKGIPDYQAFDTGIFLCSPVIFPALRDSIAVGDESLSGGIRELASKRQALTFDIRNRFWMDIDDRHAFSKARVLLQEQQSKKNQVETT
jgi:choline kinase